MQRKSWLNSGFKIVIWGRFKHLRSRRLSRRRIRSRMNKIRLLCTRLLRRLDPQRNQVMKLQELARYRKGRRVDSRPATSTTSKPAQYHQKPCQRGIREHKVVGRRFSNPKKALKLRRWWEKQLQKERGPRAHKNHKCNKFRRKLTTWTIKF